MAAFKTVAYKLYLTFFILCCVFCGAFSSCCLIIVVHDYYHIKDKSDCFRENAKGVSPNDFAYVYRHTVDAVNYLTPSKGEPKTIGFFLSDFMDNNDICNKGKQKELDCYTNELEGYEEVLNKCGLIVEKYKYGSRVYIKNGWKTTKHRIDDLGPLEEPLILGIAAIILPIFLLLLRKWLVWLIK